MRISVAIPTYRRAWSLPMALDSLLRQSRRPDEVLVVLKPSGDGSEEVLRRYEGDLPLRVAVQRWGKLRGGRRDGDKALPGRRRALPGRRRRGGRALDREV